MEFEPQISLSMSANLSNENQSSFFSELNGPNQSNLAKKVKSQTILEPFSQTKQQENLQFNKINKNLIMKTTYNMCKNSKQCGYKMLPKSLRIKKEDSQTEKRQYEAQLLRQNKQYFQVEVNNSNINSPNNIQIITTTKGSVNSRYTQIKSPLKNRYQQIKESIPITTSTNIQTLKHINKNIQLLTVQNRKANFIKNPKQETQIEQSQNEGTNECIKMKNNFDCQKFQNLQNINNINSEFESCNQDLIQFEDCQQMLNTQNTNINKKLEMENIAIEEEKKIRRHERNLYPYFGVHFIKSLENDSFFQEILQKELQIPNPIWYVKERIISLQLSTKQSLEQLISQNNLYLNTAIKLWFSIYLKKSLKRTRGSKNKHISDTHEQRKKAFLRRGKEIVEKIEQLQLNKSICKF